MTVYSLRVWLPDRPGALGQVASRIGAVRGDVVGIEILERGPAQVIDEVLVELADEDVVDLLVAEVSQVDGVAVEDVREIASGRADGGTLILDAAARLAGEGAPRRLERLCEEVRAVTGADWVVAVHAASGQTLARLGDPPDLGWVSAFLSGSSHLQPDHEDPLGPAEMSWMNLASCGVSVALERSGWPFRARERQHLGALGRLVDALGVDVDVPAVTSVSES
jgi:hypothetical protein